MNNLRNIDNDLPTLRDENLANILLYGNQMYEGKTNQITLIHATHNIIKIYKDLMNLFLVRPKTIGDFLRS